MAGYANRTYGFLMRDIGTGGGNGLQGTGMAYASVNSSSLYKTNFKVTHLKKTKRTQNTHRPILNLSIANLELIHLLSVILVTSGRWLTKMPSLKCVNFKFRYFFFNKSRKCVTKHKIAYAVHKIFLFSDCSYIRCKSSI